MSTLPIITHGDCSFKPEKMPEYAIRQMACNIYDQTVEWFQQPGVQEGFEAWLPGFREREAARLAAEAGEACAIDADGREVSK